MAVYIFNQEAVCRLSTVIRRDSVSTPVYSLTFACMLSANAAMPSLYMCAYIQCGAKMAASLYMCACIQCGAKMVEYLHPGRGVAKTSDTQR